MVFSGADFVLGLVPGLLWLVFFWRKDVWKPEPRHALLRTFALGWGAAWLVTLVRQRNSYDPSGRRSVTSPRASVLA